jgi:hypothetical protein
MTAARITSKYRPLALAALGLVALPFAMSLLGLSINTASMVVLLAMAAMGLISWSAIPG